MSKSIRIYAVFMVLLTLGKAFAGHDPVLINQIFVPPGFDDNDMVEVTFEGYLQGCLRIMGVSAERSDSGKIVVHQDVAPTTGCLTQIIPFHNTIALPFSLSKGQHEIEIHGKSSLLSIAEATSSDIDEKQYAPIDQVSIEDDDSGRSWVVLKGRFPLTCLRLQEDIQIEKVGLVLELLPEMIRDDGPCEIEDRAFAHRVRIPQLLATKYLIHVRSMSGKSFNLIHIPPPME